MPNLTDYGFTQFGKHQNISDMGFTFNRNDADLTFNTGVYTPNIIPITKDSNPDARSYFPPESVADDKVSELNVSKLRTDTLYSQRITLGVREGTGDVYIAAGTFSASAWTCTGGFIMGLDDSDSNKVKFFMGDATTSVDWNVTTANTLTVKGSITATTGTIGGFGIGSDYIRDAANSFGLASTVTGGDDVRFWAGATFANRATAPLRITESGAMTATSLTVTTGTIGGKVINSGTGADGALSSASGTTNLTLNQIYNYTSVSLTGTATLSTAESNGIMFIRCQGDFTQAAGATIDLSGKGGAGGAARVFADGAGAGNPGTEGFGSTEFDGLGTHSGRAGQINGAVPNANAGGGGGAGGYTAGSDQSGYAGEPLTLGQAGTAYTQATYRASEFGYAVWRHIYISCGSGGGSGALNNTAAGDISGAGGNGGGCLYVLVGGNLNLAGTITVAGLVAGTVTAAANSVIGGGGGGHGGMIVFLVAGTITDTSVKTVTGGAATNGHSKAGTGTGYNGGAGSAGVALILQAL